MLVNKIVIISIIFFISVGNSYCWDDESGLAEDELFNIMFNSPYLYQDINNPKWYNPIVDSVNDWIVKFEGYFIYTPPNIEVQTIIKKMVWTGSYYIEDTEFNNLNSITYFQFKSNVSESIQIPILQSMQDIFKNNTDQFEGDNFKTLDIDQDHPDLINITINIDGDGESLDFNSNGYYAFTDNALKSLRVGSMDYGFGGGKGSEAGSSSGIYDGINLYGSNAGKVIDSSILSTMFFILIPLIFIFSVIKFIMKVS